MKLPEGPLLYAILDLGYVLPQDAHAVTRQLLAGGADLLQLRAKGHDQALIRKIAADLAPLCRSAGVPFIVNDFVEIAVAVGADGVHIGQEDGSLEEVRRKTPENIYIGRSTHSPAQAAAALAEGFDYIGFGPLFPTPTKPGRPGIGLADVFAVQNTVGQSIPVFCIGGIRHDNLPQVLSAGARNVVIVSDLLAAPDITAATASVKAALGT